MESGGKRAKEALKISLKKPSLTVSNIRSGDRLQKRGCAVERVWLQSESTKEKWESSAQAQGGATGGNLLRRNIGGKSSLTGFLLKANQGKEMLPGGWYKMWIPARYDW